MILHPNSLSGEDGKGKCLGDLIIKTLCATTAFPDSSASSSTNKTDKQHRQTIHKQLQTNIHSLSVYATVQHRLYPSLRLHCFPIQNVSSIPYPIKYNDTLYPARTKHALTRQIHCTLLDIFLVRRARRTRRTAASASRKHHINFAKCHRHAETHR